MCPDENDVMTEDTLEHAIQDSAMKAFGIADYLTGPKNILNNCAYNGAGAREVALAQTKLEEAGMWLKQAIQEMENVT